jgi:hypothetical protein
MSGSPFLGLLTFGEAKESNPPVGRDRLQIIIRVSGFKSRFQYQIKYPPVAEHNYAKKAWINQ